MNVNKSDVDAHADFVISSARVLKPLYAPPLPSPRITGSLTPLYSLILLDTTQDDGRIGRTYLLVVICEIAVIGGLWLLGRFYS